MADDKNSKGKLLDISREAYKLTQMINSWPKAPNFDGRSKDVTKSLMRGAFDLQESLITLANLQEAPKVMSQNGLMGSGRFERLAMDGSLFNYIDEMKKAIRERSCSQHPAIVFKDDEKVSSSRSLRFLMSSDLNVEPKRAKGPNLIAKLMGLDEFPSETDHPARKEQRDDECLVQPRSILAIEMPKTKKLPSMEKNPELRTNTVKDIIEIAKFKELFEIDENKNHKRMSCSGNRFDNGVPTNVSMRSTPRSPHAGPRFDKVLISKKTRATNLFLEETVCDNGEMLSRKYERKEMKNVKRNRVISSQNTANLASVGQLQQRNAVISSRGKNNAGLKPLMNGKKPGDRKELKAIAAPKSQAKLISRAPVKSDNRRSIKNDVSSNDRPIGFKGVNASRKHNLTSTLKPISQNFTDLVKAKKISKAKPVRKSMDIKAVTGIANCKDVKETNQSCNLPVESPPKQVEQNSTSYNREYESKDSKLFSELTVKSRKRDKSSRAPEESQQHTNNKTISRAAAKTEEVEIQLLLLSNQSFISNAQELFGLNRYQTTDQRKQGILELGTRNAKILLDCAKELMDRKRQQLEISNHQMLQTSFWNLSVPSLDQLVDEISNGIEKLSSYTKNVAGLSLKDSVYMRLERDLRCKDMMLNAMWDVGWVNWVCVDEADNVVGQVEKLILYGLLEELVVELVC